MPILRKKEWKFKEYLLVLDEKADLSGLTHLTNSEKAVIASAANGTMWTEGFIDLYYKAKYCERMTFVWLANPNDRYLLHNMHDEEGKYFMSSRDNIDWILNRPVLYLNEVTPRTVLFRAYV